ncbi:hypothetical protein KAH94_02865 [bacterium]|nr:hypothetical protein [bacterium]
MKTHIINKTPYHTGTAWNRGDSVKYSLYKSLCGIKEPKSQVYGDLKPTCKKCINIQKSKNATQKQLKAHADEWNRLIKLSH